MQEGCILGNHTDLLTQTCLFDLSNVLAIDPDRTRLKIIKAQEQIRHCALACARRTNQADFFACGDPQIEIIDDRALTIVGKTNLGENDFTVRYD